MRALMDIVLGRGMEYLTLSRRLDSNLDLTKKSSIFFIDPNNRPLHHTSHCIEIMFLW